MNLGNGERRSPEASNGVVEVGSLQLARVDHLYHQGIDGIRASMVGAIILTISLWGKVPLSWLIGWLVCYTTAYATGEALFRSYREAADVHERSSIWGRRAVMLSVVGGMLWGVTPLLLFPQSLFHQALLTFVVGGMSVGVTISHGAVAAAHIPFILAVYIPLIGRYLYEGDEIHITMAILLLIFMVYLIGAARRMFATITESLNLRFQKQALIEGLKREKAASDRLNESLRSEIRERRQAQEAFLESEARYRQLFDVSPYPMVVHDGHTILRINPAAAALAGMADPAALHGRSIWDFIDPSLREEVQERITRLADGTEAIEFLEIKFLLPGGSVADVEVVSVPTIYGSTPAFLAVGRDITEAKKAQEKLRASLQEKEALLREIHHRVKNNLQVISSLLRLQFRYMGEKPVEEILFDTQNRLLSMSLIHEKLYQSENVGNIDFREYINELLSHLFHSFAANKKQITLINKVERVFLPLDTAIPCGLIVNELVSNCLKHAFPEGRNGFVKLATNGRDDGLELVIADNGVGIPAQVDIAAAQTLGLRLVDTLVKQLGGELTISGTEGTEIRIKLGMLQPTS
jgi:PAS domain S-box-containing protein